MNKFEHKVTELGYIEATPKPSEEELAKFYREIYYGEGVTSTYQISYNDQEIDQKRLRAECTVELLSSNLPRKSSDSQISALEVGCGEGFTLSAFIKKGWSATGVDFQAAPVLAMNPDVMPNFVEADPTEYLRSLISNGEKFDVIVLQNVLEHVRDPLELMGLLIEAIDDTGCILVQVPNDFSDLQGLAKQRGRIEHDYWFCPPQHLSYFNESSLRNFISSAGGQIVDGISDFPIELYLWGSRTNYATDKDMGKFAHGARVELDLFISRSGIERYLEFYRSCFKVGLGRNLCAVVRKDRNKD